MNLSSRENVLREQLILDLYSSSNLPEVLDRVRVRLLQLIPAEYMGLCIVTPGQPVEYEWLGAGRPQTLLARYDELASADFVRTAILRQPDKVFRDSEMLSRKELESSVLYQRSRELDLRLEQVMAVLLSINPGVYGGFAMYRDRRRPFSEHASALLQGLAPHVTRAVQRCRVLATTLAGDQLLEELYRRQGAAFLIVEPPAFERLRSPRATALLDKWFARSELHVSGIPRVLVERLDALTRMDADARLLADTWETSRHNEDLRVTFIELPEHAGVRRWALTLHEFPPSLPMPAHLARQLTPRQRDILRTLLSNWKDPAIADEFDITPATVKTHVRNIFKKLELNDRADLLYQVARFLKPV